MLGLAAVPEDTTVGSEVDAAVATATASRVKEVGAAEEGMVRVNRAGGTVVEEKRVVVLEEATSAEVGATVEEAMVGVTAEVMTVAGASEVAYWVAMAATGPEREAAMAGTLSGNSPRNTNRACSGP